LGTWYDEYHNLNVMYFTNITIAVIGRKQEHLAKFWLMMEDIDEFRTDLHELVCVLHLQARHCTLTKLLKPKRSEVCLVLLLFGQDLSEY